MASEPITALAVLLVPQADMKMYACVNPFTTSLNNRQITANDLLATITAAIADLSVQWDDGAGVATVSAAGKAKIRFNLGGGRFEQSINGGAYIPFGGGGSFALSGTQVVTNATQSVTSNVLTTITFNTTVWDDNSFFSGGDPTKITFNTSGRYQIDVQVSWDNPGTGQFIAQARLNGVGGANEFLARDFRVETAVGSIIVQNFSFILDATAADFITIEAFQSTGVGVNLSGAAGIQSPACRVWVTALFN